MKKHINKKAQVIPDKITNNQPKVPTSKIVETPQTKHSEKKIFLINLGILLAVTIIVSIATAFTYNSDNLFRMILLMYWVIGHTGTNFLLSIIFLFQKKYRKAGIFLINAIFTFIIGFGLCWGSYWVIPV